MTSRIANNDANGALTRGLSAEDSRIPPDAGDAITFTGPAIPTTYTLASLGILPSAKGTYLIKATVTNVTSGTSQTLFHIDAGSTTNRYLLQQPGGTDQIQLFRTTGGAATTDNAGAVVDATEFSAGMVIDGDGNASASLNGAAVGTVTGGVTGGLDTLRIGEAVSGVGPLVGSIAKIVIYPGVAMSAAQLQAAVAAL